METSGSVPRDPRVVQLNPNSIVTSAYHFLNKCPRPHLLSASRPPEQQRQHSNYAESSRSFPEDQQTLCALFVCVSVCGVCVCVCLGGAAVGMIQCEGEIYS